MPASPPVESQEKMSQENNILLVQLSKNVDTFVREQQAENRTLHKRIDDVAERTALAIESVKDVLAKSGKVSPQFIISLVAILVSLCTLIGGIVTAYVSVRIDTLKPDMEQQRRVNEQQAAAHDVFAEQLIQTRISQAVTAALLEERTSARAR